MTGKPDMPEERDDTGSNTDPDPARSSSPSGAILVTTFLTVVILVFWFGTYIFNVLRS